MMVARGGIEPPTRGFSVRRFQGLINQPLAALASPDPSLTQAQSRHTQSELVTFPAQRRLWPDSILGTGCLAATISIDNRPGANVLAYKKHRQSPPLPPRAYQATSESYNSVYMTIGIPATFFGGIVE